MLSSKSCSRLGVRSNEKFTGHYDGLASTFLPETCPQCLQKLMATFRDIPLSKLTLADVFVSFIEQQALLNHNTGFILCTCALQAYQPSNIIYDQQEELRPSSLIAVPLAFQLVSCNISIGLGEQIPTIDLNNMAVSAHFGFRVDSRGRRIGCWRVRVRDLA